jgi:hypothetical protein
LAPGDDIEDRFASAVKAAVDASDAISQAPEAITEPAHKSGHSRVRVWGIALLCAASVTAVAIVVAAVLQERHSRLARLAAVMARATDEARQAVDDVKQAIWAGDTPGNPRVTAPTPESATAAPSPSIMAGSESPTPAISASAAVAPSAAAAMSESTAAAFGVPSAAASSATTLASNSEAHGTPASTPGAAGELQRPLTTPAPPSRNSPVSRQMRRPTGPSKQPSTSPKTGHRAMTAAAARASGLESGLPEQSAKAQATSSRDASINSSAIGEAERKAPPNSPSPRSRASLATRPQGRTSIDESGVTGKSVFESRLPAGTALAPETPTAEAAVRAPAASPAEARSVLVASADHSVYWALEDSGAIFRSIDQKTWQKQDSGVRSDLLGGHAPSNAVCWAVGRNGTILLTTDGTRWQRVPSPTTADLIAVSAASADVADIVAADGSRFNTFDGGSNWQRIK